MDFDMKFFVNQKSLTYIMNQFFFKQCIVHGIENILYELDIFMLI